MPQHILKFSLSPEEFAQRCAVLEKGGITLSGNSGDVTYKGVEIAYQYDGTTLVITIEHKPWIDPESAVESAIKNWFASLADSGGGTQ